MLEECGYDVPLDKLELVVKCPSNVGIGCEYMNVFYAEVSGH